jgi:SAM-dependent methyltransferase
LLYSKEWPQAVYDAQIADENSEKDKDERAEGITDILLPSLDGKRFLDFGCGEGHIVNYASKFALKSVGYDIVKNSRSRFDWEDDSEGILFTTDFEKAKSNGPYDIILIYDVLDHAQNSAPQEILVAAKSLLAEGGKIYLRTHPWTARHGGHSYRKINKAFVHLVFTEDELKSIGLELENNLKLTFPLHSYESWIKDSGLKNSIEPELDQQDVEPFFRDNPIVKSRIMRHLEVKEWGEGIPPGRPEWQMSQCFWDFVLEKE